MFAANDKHGFLIGQKFKACDALVVDGFAHSRALLADGTDFSRCRLGLDPDKERRVAVMLCERDDLPAIGLLVARTVDDNRLLGAEQLTDSVVGKLVCQLWVATGEIM